MAARVLNYPSYNSLSPRRSDLTVRSMSKLGISEAEIENDIDRSFSASQYMQRLENLSTLMQHTVALRGVQSNWDSYGAEGPQGPAIRAAIDFLEKLNAQHGILPTRSLPSAEGGVAFRFACDDKRALVEFLNTGSIDVMLYNEAGILAPTAEELGSPEKALEAVQAHLTR